MDEVVLAYITTETPDEARHIGRRLVEEGLAACVNIVGGMESIYRWQGSIEATQETVLIAKTRASFGERLSARVGELHSYQCPCVVLLPVIGGNPAYLQWLRDETEPVRGPTIA